jgi:UDP-GlcNAc:undecaprenyl-phosphate GlcNAc-1-phosphate transferase
MIVSFIGSVCFNPELVISPAIWSILVGAIAILVFGVADDRADLSWKWQLMFQIGLGMLLIAVGVEIPYLTIPWGGVLPIDFLTIFIAERVISVISLVVILLWTVGVVNAINWADGIDGLAGMIGMVSMAAIALISQRPEVNQPAIVILALIGLGTLLGFWVWNMYPARIEAGTSGSYFMGWMIATLAVIAGTKMATTLIVVVIPLMDAFWVVGERIAGGYPITKKDVRSRHLHYRLRTLGWSDTAIVLCYAGFLILMMGLQPFLDRPIEKLMLLVADGLLLTGILFFVRRKIIALEKSLF